MPAIVQEIPRTSVRLGIEAARAPLTAAESLLGRSDDWPPTLAFDSAAAQVKTVAGTLRLALSQYRDLEAFAAFASDLDAASKAQLERGARLVELLKQPQYSPFPVEKQVVSVWSGTSGELDDVPVEDIRRFEAGFLEYIESSHKGLLTGIRETSKLSDDALTTLKDAITEFKKGFTTSAGTLLGAEEPVEPLASDEVEQETIKRVKKA